MAHARAQPKTSEGARMLLCALARKGKAAPTEHASHCRQPSNRAMSLGCSMPRPTTRSYMHNIAASMGALSTLPMPRDRESSDLSEKDMQVTGSITDVSLIMNLALTKAPASARVAHVVL